MEEIKNVSKFSRRSFLSYTSATALIATTEMTGFSSILEAASRQKPFALPSLPYKQNALAPYISQKTIGFHYGKHHRGYVNKLNNQVANTEYEKMPLEKVIEETADRSSAIFNNAAQVWNHTFYWNSMKRRGGGKPAEKLLKKIVSDFGGFESFKREFADTAASQFGSGWAWLVFDKGKLRIVKTGNADIPLTRGLVPLLTIDVWEHAYYLDYQNRRKDYIAAYLNHLINWNFAEKNLERTG
jgi:Fe-Mn family superoxide dismutase